MRRRTALVLVSALLFAPAAFAQQRPVLVPPPEELPAPQAPAGEGTPTAGTSFIRSIDFGFRGTSATGDEARYERYRDLRDGSWTRFLFGRNTDQFLFAAQAFEVAADEIEISIQEFVQGWQWLLHFLQQFRLLDEG